MEYQIHILALGYLVTALCTCQFLSPRGKKEGYYSIFLAFMGKNDKMMKKISKISGIELGYSDLSPLYPPGTESELTTRLAVNRWYVTTESYYGW